MDAGVGAFVFLSGLSSRLARSSTAWSGASRRSAFPVTPLVCAVLGLGRLLAVRALGYQVRGPTIEGHPSTGTGTRSRLGPARST